MLCIYIYTIQQTPRALLPCRTKALYHSTSTSLFPSPHSMATRILQSIYMILTILDSTYTTDHTTFAFLSVYFTQHFLQVHPYYHKRQNIFFKVCLYFIVCICRIFFMHSSVHGHGGCFHIRAIVNNSAMNMEMH